MNCLDGSGPIPPVPVTCEFLPDGRNLTYIAHEQMESTKVIIIIFIIILIRGLCAMPHNLFNNYTGCAK